MAHNVAHQFQTPGFNPSGVLPNIQTPQPPNPLDQFLGSQGGSLLVNLLAQQGFSPVPQSPLGALGRGLQQTQQQGQQRGRSALEDELIRSRIGLNRAQTAGGGPAGATNVQSQFITKDNKLAFLRRNGEVVVTEQDVKQQFDIRQLADGSSIAVNRTNPNEILPVVSEDDARLAAVRKKSNEVQASAVTALPGAVDKSATALDILDELETHQGFSGAVGLKGLAQLGGVLDEPLAGTPEADFVALVNQASGTVFLEAFQELKGGGHITEIEGQKAEEAIARINNRDQTEAGYKRAISDLRKVIKDGLERKRRAARGEFTPSTPTPPTTPASEMTIEQLQEIASGGNP